MSDRLKISGLKISTHIGVHPWEQRILQQLLIDIDIPVDISTCHNQLENTLDYAALCESITTFIESTSFTLIETVAEEVAAFIKTHFKVSALTITISKPHAIKNASNVSVSITR